MQYLKPQAVPGCQHLRSIGRSTGIHYGEPSEHENLQTLWIKKWQHYICINRSILCQHAE